MTVEATIVERIEALSRSEFRASVNAERRATLAIGALVLHWGQFDSSLGSLIQWMREKHEALGLSGLPEEHPIGIDGRLNLLRKFIKECSRDPVHLAGFDKLRARVSRNKNIRDDLVHGAMSLANEVSFDRGPDGFLRLRRPLGPDRRGGTDAGICVFCAPYRKPRKKKGGMTAPGHLDLVAHLLSEIFEAADQLYDDRGSLENLVRVTLGLDPIPFISARAAALGPNDSALLK
jgi:hypothetical protein